METEDYDLGKLAEVWPAPIVARSEVGRFTGGLLNPRSLANLDSRGEGCPKIIIGRRVCYDKFELINFLKRRQVKNQEL
jgi:hypothetical protein